MFAAELVMVLFSLPPYLFPQPVDPWVSWGSNPPTAEDDAGWQAYLLLMESEV